MIAILSDGQPVKTNRLKWSEKAQAYPKQAEDIGTIGERKYKNDVKITTTNVPMLLDSIPNET
jgi:hypothetical protein